MKQHDDIHSRLHSALKKEKAYLDPTLTLARLSLIVGTAIKLTRPNHLIFKYGLGV